MSSENFVRDNIINRPVSSEIQVNTCANQNTFLPSMIVDPPTKNNAIINKLDQDEQDKANLVKGSNKNGPIQICNIFRNNIVSQSEIG
jgi:hypothetical protein